MEKYNRKIVFVVGAGASVDFGFPLGDQLAGSIRSKIDSEFHEANAASEDTPIRTALRLAGKVSDEYGDAARQLRAGIGMGESIDRFLFRRRNDPLVRQLGMVALAECILECERKSQLSNFDINDFETSLNTLRNTQNSWPAVLLDEIVDGLGPEEIVPTLFEDFAFIIFNYDRCVEWLLFHYLHRRHHLPPAAALEVVRSIPMIHVYGVLGDPFDGKVPFGASVGELTSIAEGLQTYHEDRIDAERQRVLDQVMFGAEKVCFLGFGFLQENFARLFPGNDVGAKQLSGTMIGCQHSPAFQIAQRSVGSAFQNGNCTEFLRNYGGNVLSGLWAI